MELYFIRHGLARRTSHIHAPVASHGVVQFMPVRVQAVQPGSRLKTEFLWNPYPLVERSVLDGAVFPYCFYTDGLVQLAPKQELQAVQTKQDAYESGRFYVPNWIAEGDILLATRRRPELR